MAPLNTTKSLYGITLGTMAAGKAVILDSNSQIEGDFKQRGANHFKLETTDDSKNVRINSRDYPGISGDSSGMQCKPNRSVTGTASITGGEFSPRFAAGIGGANLVGIKCDPLLKAGSGNLSGKVAGIEVNIDFGTSGTRTITGDVSAFETFLAIPSGYTYSGDISVIRIRGVNIKAWDYFLNCDNASVGAVSVAANGMFKNPEADTEAGFLKIKIASTSYEVPFYASS